MWVLLLMVLTSKGEVIAYDQGHFTSWGDCRNLGKMMVSELDGNYTFTCVEWKERK